MTPEELKQIAQSYGESVANSFDYDMFTNPDFKHKLKAKGEANKAQSVLEWLSKDYIIIPKIKVKEWQLIVEDALKSDRVITEDAWRFMWERLFGKDTFEEEGE